MTPTDPEQNPDPIQPVEPTPDPTPEPSPSPTPIVPVTPPTDQDPSSGSGSDQDPGSGSGSGSDQNPGSGSGSDQDPDSGSGSGSDQDPGSGSGSGSDQDLGSGSGSDQNPGSGSGSDQDPGSGSGSDQDPDSGSGSGSDQDPGSGSGSDQDPGSGSDQDPAPVHATIHLQVIDGYLEDATVFVDCNRNFSREDNEPVGTTDASGMVTLEVSDVNQCPYPMKIISESARGDTNTILGMTTSLSQDVVLTAHVYRENISNNDIVRITPFTTLADIVITPENLPNTYEEYKNYISRVIDYINPGSEDDSLNISLENVLSDYNFVGPHYVYSYYAVVAGPLKKKNLATLIAGELIVRTNLLPKTIEETKVRTTLRTYRNEEDTFKEDVIKESLGQYKQIVKTVADSFWAYASGYGTQSCTADGDVALCDYLFTLENNLVETLNIATGTLSKSFRSLGSGPAEDWRCGVTKTNNVYCVGNNSRGTLGDPDKVRVDENGKGTTVEGNFETSAVAVKVMQGGELVPLTGIKSVALGNQHACAVSFAGDVYCWGNNNHGQLGFVPNDGEISEENGNDKSYYAVRVLKGQQGNNDSEYLSNVDYLQLGHEHSCALTFNGEVYCWGNNSSYQLGGNYGSVLEGGYEHRKNFAAYNGLVLDMWTRDVYVPVKVEFPTEEVEKVNFLSNGYWSHCALVDRIDSDSHNVYCWGSDSAGVISHNFNQYRDDFNETFAGKPNKEGDIYNLFMNYDYISNHWMYDYNDWFVYDISGDSRYPIYGQSVTNIKNYFVSKGTERKYFQNDPLDYCKNDDTCRNLSVHISPSSGGVSYANMYEIIKPHEIEDEDLTNVKSISLSEFDGRMHLIRDNQSLVRVLDLHLLGGGHVKKDVPSSVVSNIYPNIELNSACYFDNDNKVRCYTNREKNQLLGNGDSVTFENGYFIGTVKETDGSELMNVQDLSMNRNSVCAILLQPDQSYGQTSVYCWGSAFFGQMGYMSDIIDTDRAVSYDDVLSANSFFQNRTKYYATPVNLWGN